MDNIVKIRSAIYSDSYVIAMNLAKEDLFPDIKNNQSLTNFQPATEEEIPKIVLALKSTSCNLDPIDIPLLKISVGELHQTITKITNSSVSSYTLLYSMKEAFVTPLLKKQHRPVSNLSFVSEIHKVSEPKIG